jgi:iron complex outermembrane receptor protein/outer membrane receptor for ferric coprogen and ferric-rhodotorulic acid
VGVKGELYGGRLNVSAAIFQIKRTGVFKEDKNNPGVCTSSLVSANCYVNGGKSQSKGFELEATGEVARGWQVAAGYTHATNSDDSGEPISAETPKHLLRASTNYRLQGDLADWTVGGGLSAQSSYGFKTGTAYIQESGRAVWDLNTSYRINRQWTAAVRIANLFDRNYYGMVGGVDRGNYYGQPRSATLTVRGSF